MGLLTVLKASDVKDPRSFADYAQQRLGTPLPRGKEMATLHVRLKEFWAANPRATWKTVVATVDWCAAKKRRPTSAWAVLACFRWAWADGAIQLPDLVDEHTESCIERALQEETDEAWRRMLIGAQGVNNRQQVYAAWKRRDR